MQKCSLFALRVQECRLLTPQDAGMILLSGGMDYSSALDLQTQQNKHTL
jgi:hypothetical protein